MKHTIKLIIVSTILVLSTLIGSVVSQSSSSDHADCIYHNGGTSYDLKQLPTSITAQFANNGQYIFNPCTQLSDTTTCAQLSVNEPSICFINPVDSPVIAGSYAHVAELDQSNYPLGIRYGGGSKCGTYTTISEVYFQCQEDTDGTIISAKPSNMQSGSNCFSKFTLQIGAKMFCPQEAKKTSKISGGDVFLIIFFCGFGSYFLIGLAIQLKRGRRGKEAIPNHEFWGSFFSHVGDGAKFIKGKVTGNGYQKM